MNNLYHVQFRNKQKRDTQYCDRKNANSENRKIFHRLSYRAIERRMSFATYATGA